MPNLPADVEPNLPTDVESNLPRIESKFRLVHIAARRAEQLVQGARPKMESKVYVKPTRIALEEVEHDLVRWALPDQIPADEGLLDGAGGEGLADPLPLADPAG